MYTPFVFDGYLNSSATPALFVFDGYLFNETIEPVIPRKQSKYDSYMQGHGGGAPPRYQEPVRPSIPVINEDVEIFIIIKSFLTCQ